MGLDGKICIGGALRSPTDHRDYISEIILSLQNINLPAILDYRDNIRPITNKSSEERSVAVVTAILKEYKNPNYAFSSNFIYNLRSNYPKICMCGRDAMRVLLYYGVPHDYLYPYDVDKHPKKISQKILSNAREHCISRYARVETFVGARESLFRNGPCLAVFPVYNDSKEFWRRGKNDKLIGGHAVCIVGYNKNGFILQNNWGTDWGDGGYTIYPYFDWGSHWEIWTIFDTTTDQQPPLPTIKKSRRCVLL